MAAQLPQSGRPQPALTTWPTLTRYSSLAPLLHSGESGPACSRTAKLSTTTPYQSYFLGPRGLATSACLSWQPACSEPLVC
jgi:hypothetical protein